MNIWKEKLREIIVMHIKYVIFKCPNCGYKITAPKGNGTICIKCPKCRIEFSKKT